MEAALRVIPSDYKVATPTDAEITGIPVGNFVECERLPLRLPVEHNEIKFSLASSESAKAPVILGNRHGGLRGERTVTNRCEPHISLRAQA